MVPDISQQQKAILDMLQQCAENQKALSALEKKVVAQQEKINRNRASIEEERKQQLPLENRIAKVKKEHQQVKETIGKANEVFKFIQEKMTCPNCKKVALLPIVSRTTGHIFCQEDCTPSEKASNDKPPLSFPVDDWEGSDIDSDSDDMPPPLPVKVLSSKPSEADVKSNIASKGGLVFNLATDQNFDATAGAGLSFDQFIRQIHPNFLHAFATQAAPLPVLSLKELVSLLSSEGFIKILTPEPLKGTINYKKKEEGDASFHLELRHWAYSERGRYAAEQMLDHLKENSVLTGGVYFKFPEDCPEGFKSKFFKGLRKKEDWSITLNPARDVIKIQLKKEIQNKADNKKNAAQPSGAEKPVSCTIA